MSGNVNNNTEIYSSKFPVYAYSIAIGTRKFLILWYPVQYSIARAGTLLTKCMREVNLSYKSASRLLNPNMICEFPLLFCMGPIQNVFTP